MTAQQQQWISFEQPLTERVRTMLRLEFLFTRAREALLEQGIWASRTAVECLVDVMSVLGRTDLKKELIKELERHAVTLDSLARNPNVDPQRLEHIQQQVSQYLTRLKGTEVGFGHALRSNEMFNSVRQRSAIPAGTCDFDLPAYHHWLKSDPLQRRVELKEWISHFDVLHEATDLCLNLVRESGVTTAEQAHGGMFQRTLETATPCQMIRVCIANDSMMFPEISAGRHRFTVRFMQQPDPAERASQVQSEVDFQLVCCVI
ncbi:MAG: cell division protein ZapD [Gammaproteobacteria bacterium]|jgi:cell division protein ZapD